MWRRAKASIGTRFVVAAAIAAALSATNVVASSVRADANVIASRGGAGTTANPSTMQLVSVGMNGAEADGASLYPTISDDDRYVFFMSDATNLVPNDTNNSGDVFVRDLVLGVTNRVSVDADGVQLPNGAQLVGASSDGRYVALTTQDPAVTSDTNGAFDVYRRDMATATNALVSVTPQGGAGDAVSFGSSISRDGRFVGFNSYATDIAPHPSSPSNSVYLRDTTHNTTQVVTPQGLCQYCTWRVSDISDDGQHVIGDVEVSTYHVTSMVSDVRVSDGSQTPIVASDPRGCSVGPARYRHGASEALYTKSCNYSAPYGGLSVAQTSTGVSTFVDLGVGTNTDTPDTDVGEQAVAFVGQMPGWAVNGGDAEVLVSDLTSAPMYRVSAAYDGGAADGWSAHPSLGTNLATFASYGTNLVSHDSNGVPDIYARNWRNAPTFVPPTLAASDITIVAPLPGHTAIATITPVYQPSANFDASYTWKTVDGSANSTSDYIDDSGVGTIDTVAGTATAIQVTINGSNSTAIRQFTVQIATNTMRGFTKDATITIVPPGTPLQRPVVVSWSATENARLNQIGNYLGLTPSEVQHVAVYLLAYLNAAAHIEPSPVTLPTAGSAASYTTTWTPGEYGVLDNVRDTYFLGDADATRFALATLDYLLALTGH